MTWQEIVKNGQQRPIQGILIHVYLGVVITFTTTFTRAVVALLVRPLSIIVFLSVPYFICKNQEI